MKVIRDYNKEGNKSKGPKKLVNNWQRKYGEGVTEEKVILDSNTGKFAHTGNDGDVMYFTPDETMQILDNGIYRDIGHLRDLESRTGRNIKGIMKKLRKQNVFIQ